MSTLPPASTPSAIPGGNLFNDAEPPAQGERFDTLLARRNLVVERIVSSSEIVPLDYVQAQDEWVLVLRGQAELRVGERVHTLAAGDYLFLPAGTAHRVERTAAGTLWLAVHLHPDPAGGDQ